MIEIKVLNNYAEVAYKQGTKVVRKIVGVSEIPALFETKVTYDSGILPVFGTQNAYGVQRIIQRDQGMIILVQAINPFVNIKHTELSTLSSSEREYMGIEHCTASSSDYVEDKVNYYVYKDVYFPNLLMSMHLKKNGDKYYVADSGILGFKDSFITDSTELLMLPYANIYRESTHGRICWGNTELNIQGPSSSVSIIQSFLGGIMNNDLFDEFYIRDYELECCSQLLAYLAVRAKSNDITRFPYEDVHLDHAINYKNLINYLTQTWT